MVIRFSVQKELIMSEITNKYFYIWYCETSTLYENKHLLFVFSEFQIRCITFWYFAEQKKKEFLEKRWNSCNEQLVTNYANKEFKVENFGLKCCNLFEAYIL